MHRFTLPALVLATAFATGCYADGVGYSATVSNAGYGVDLVYAAPGVQVIADYNEPIFYADGFYWRFSDNLWYRSTYYTGGWGYYATPPSAIVGIRRPHDYVHYRPQGWTPRRQQPIVRDHRMERPIVRDHREERRPPPPPRHVAPPPSRPAPPPPPPTRDHRDHRDRHD